MTRPGIEPATSRSQSGRSSNWATMLVKVGQVNSGTKGLRQLSRKLFPDCVSTGYSRYIVVRKKKIDTCIYQTETYETRSWLKYTAFVFEMKTNEWRQGEIDIIFITNDEDQQQPARINQSLVCVFVVPLWQTLFAFYSHRFHPGFLKWISQS